jgi:hypothetical protein
MHGACGDNDDVARVQYMADATLDARSTDAGPARSFCASIQQGKRAVHFAAAMEST